MTKAKAVPVKVLMANAIAIEKRILIENTKNRNTTRKMSAASMRTPLSAASILRYSAFNPAQLFSESMSWTKVSTFLSDDTILFVWKQIRWVCDTHLLDTTDDSYRPLRSKLDCLVRSSVLDVFNKVVNFLH